LPERWLAKARESNSPFAADDQTALRPFSIGPRHCIGKNLAYLEMRLILARMVWAFDISGGGIGKDVRWEDQKTYMLVEKKPFEIRLNART
jgi:cytochrome P450